MNAHPSPHPTHTRGADHLSTPGSVSPGAMPSHRSLCAACVLALAFYLMIEIIRIAGPVIFTTVNFIVPLAAIGWGIIFFDESHSIWIWAALALMILGVLLVNRPSKSAG